jgi:hypothetical protein
MGRRWDGDGMGAWTAGIGGWGGSEGGVNRYYGGVMKVQGVDRVVKRAVRLELEVTDVVYSEARGPREGAAASACDGVGHVVCASRGRMREGMGPG